MQIFHKLEDVPVNFGPALVTVGNFDGVHRAHAHVLKEIVSRAQASNAKAIAVTFEPHPTRILRPEAGLKLLTPTPEKLRLLEATGIDAVLLLPFGRDLSLMTPRQFADRILKKKLHAREVHEGFNFRFGHKAAGDMTLLAELGSEMGFEVKVYPEMTLRGETVSSSHIRKLLPRAAQAARAICWRVHSAFSAHPAAAAAMDRNTLCPPSTSRATKNSFRRMASTSPGPASAAERFDSVTNIGNRPTFGAELFAIETHLLNFHPIELTPETEVEICFLQRLRDEIKFPNVDALREQIARDVKKARRYFHLLRKQTPNGKAPEPH